MDWYAYEALTLRNPSYPSVYKIMEGIFAEHKAVLKREELVDMVCKRTKIDKEDVHNHISTILNALQKRGVIYNVKHGYWKAV